MIRAILWKEWHEHRSKYVVYWFLLNVPVLLLAIALGIGAGRTPFADLSDRTVLKYLILALGEPFLLVTLFLLVTGYLAVATFAPETEDGTLFFVYEQPVSRRRYIAMKLLIGGAFTIFAVCFAVLFATVAGYAMMLVSGRVTWAGSAGPFAAVLSAAARAAVWCSLISLIVFTGSALASALLARRWLAGIASVAIAVLVIYAGRNLFDFTADISQQEPMSIGWQFGTGDQPWINVSRAMHFSEIASFAHLRALPLTIALLLTMAFSVATAQLYGRKELK